MVVRHAAWKLYFCSLTAFASLHSQTADLPLPNIPKLMHEVEDHQRVSEAIQKDYIYHAVQTGQDLDKHGSVKKTEVKEYDIFWINGVEVQKLLRKDGRDLSPDEAKKESDRIDKEVAKAKEKREKKEARGKNTDSRGDDEITVSRFLELGTFTNPRRIQLNGRNTIAVDYTGDPKAKTKNTFENVIRDMAGTIWVDEQDREITQLQGHFVNNFKIAGGLAASIQKDTNFAMTQTKINNEIWLPAHVEGHGEARAFLFFKFNGNLTVAYSNYRKFKTTSTILPVGTNSPN